MQAEEAHDSAEIYKPKETKLHPILPSRDHLLLSRHHIIIIIITHQSQDCRNFIVDMLL